MFQKGPCYFCELTPPSEISCLYLMVKPVGREKLSLDRQLCDSDNE